MATTLLDASTAPNRKGAEAYFAQCKQCFMTGKACIYQREIAQHLTRVRSSDSPGGLAGSAFMLMPFRSTLDEVYRAQLEPCLLSVVAKVRRADDVARTGYVICEKICKQIQLADVICAELSCDNANVFYELGLSYAIDRNIALFIQKSVQEKRGSLIKKLGLGIDHYNLYDPFEMLDAKTVNLWNASDHKVPPTSKNDKVAVLLADTTPFSETVNGQILAYTVDALSRGAIHRTLDKFRKQDGSSWDMLNRHTITVRADGYIENAKEITFPDVEERIRNASCVLICTHESEPCSYFWLGFAHGLEKDVIPITVQCDESERSPGNAPSSLECQSKKQSTMGLPFDMRALWHVSFPHAKPTDLESQLESILRIVSSRNRDKLGRRRFWHPFLAEGNVSVYVGSVELTEKNKRHVVGEWDYRAVSELTSFFASIKETMETAIQTPTFQASMALRGTDGKLDEDLRRTYVDELVEKLRVGNSIILASADVNDMTEVALATHAGVEPFVSHSWKDPSFNGVVGFKSHAEAAFSTPSVYFQSIDPSEAQGRRGFYNVQGGSTHPERTYGSPYVPYSERTKNGYSVYYSHVAKFRIQESNHWTVVLQGITGPATLGVAQALTGGVNEQFTVFSSAVSADKRDTLFRAVAKESQTLAAFLGRDNIQVSPSLFEEHAESVTESLTATFDADDPVEAVIQVYIMDGGDTRHDERLIIWWDIAMEPRRMASPGKGRSRRRS